MTLRLANTSLDWRLVEGEILALDLRGSEYLSVNRTGALLWQELATGSTPDHLVDRLARQTGIDRERAARDVDAFLTQLREQGLLIEEVSLPETPATD